MKTLRPTYPDFYRASRLEQRRHPIFIIDNVAVSIRPLNGQCLIAPPHTPLRLLIVKIRRLVAKFCIVFKREKTVCKPLRDKESLPVFEEKSLCPPKCQRALTEIDDGIIDLPSNGENTLCLRLCFLEVEASESSFFRYGEIILDKVSLDTKFPKIRGTKELAKISTTI